MKYTGSCHCGAIKFSFEGKKIDKGLRCTCSICARRGALMTPYAIPPDKLCIEADERDLGVYQFDSKIARHYFCKNCGIYPFHATAKIPGHFRANIGCLEEVDSFSLEADIFDGKNWQP